MFETRSPLRLFAGRFPHPTRRSVWLLGCLSCLLWMPRDIYSAQSRSLGPVLSWKANPGTPVLLLDAGHQGEFRRRYVKRPYNYGYRLLKDRGYGYANPNHDAYLGDAFWSGGPLALLQSPPDSARYAAQALIESSFVAQIEGNRDLRRLCLKALRHILNEELSGGTGGELAPNTAEVYIPVEDRALSEARLFLAATIAFDHLYPSLETKERPGITAKLREYRERRQRSVMLEGVPDSPARILFDAGQALSAVFLSLADRLQNRGQYRPNRWLVALHESLLDLEEDLQAAHEPSVLLSKGLEPAADALWMIDVVRDLIHRLGGPAVLTYDKGAMVELIGVALVPDSQGCLNPFNTQFGEAPFGGWPPVLGDLLLTGAPRLTVTGASAMEAAAAAQEDEAVNRVGVGTANTPDAKAREQMQDHLRDVFAGQANPGFVGETSQIERPAFGWAPPRMVEQPTAWAAWLRRQAAASPQGVASSLWSGLAAGRDSHVGSMVLPWPRQKKTLKLEQPSGILPNVGLGMSMLKLDDNNERLLWAAQQDVRHATGDESICGHLVVDQDTPWRWIERWPSSLLAPSNPSIEDEGLSTTTMHVWRSPGRTDRWHVVREGLPFAHRLVWVVLSAHGLDALPHYSIDLQLSEDEVIESAEDFAGHIVVQPERKPGRPQDMTVEQQIIRRQEAMEKTRRQRGKLDSAIQERGQRLDFLAEDGGLLRILPFESPWGRRARLEMSPSGSHSTYLMAFADRRPLPPEVSTLDLEKGSGWRIKWPKGSDVLAISHGEGIEGEGISTDALAVLITRNKVLRRWSYLAIDATRLRYRMSLLEPKGTTLLESPNRVTVILDGRMLHYLGEAPEGAAAFAPGVFSIRDHNGPVPHRVRLKTAIVSREGRRRGAGSSQERTREQ